MPTELVSDLATLLREGRFVDAVQLYQEYSGVTSSEASSFITDLVNGLNVECPTFFAKPKVDKEMPDYVQAVQDVAIVTTNKVTESKLVRKANVVEKLAEYDDDIIIYALGAIGEDFVSFREAVHVNHPALSMINSGTLLQGGKVFERFSETVELARFCRENKFKTMPTVIREWLNRNHTRIRKVLQKPPAGLLKSQKARNKARSVAKPKEISLTSVYETGRKETWDALPGSLSPYVRMGLGFTREKEQLDIMGKRFRSFGMIDQEAALIRSGTKLDKFIADQYFGFIRIKMADAAVIAGKAMGADWMSSSHVRIVVPTKHFTTHIWRAKSAEGSGDIKDDPLLTDVFERHIQVEASYPQTGSTKTALVFAPRAYPLCHFKADMPEGVSKVIEAVESHPDASGGPIFDNLWVIVPSVNLHSSSGDRYEFYDGEKHCQFYDYWAYCHALDTFLTDTQQVYPILIGEQVTLKKCFFLSYWA